MANFITDAIKSQIADLKSRKEHLKKSSQAEIDRIELRIAELQRLNATVTADTEATVKLLMDLGVLKG